MNIVLYTNDMDPITVIEVPEWGMKMLRDGQTFRVAAPPLLPTRVFDGDPLESEPIKTATVWAERFVRRNVAHWMFFTNDDINALLLESQQLPGQRKDFQAEYKRGYGTGFTDAILRLIG